MKGSANVPEAISSLQKLKTYRICNMDLKHRAELNLSVGRYRRWYQWWFTSSYALLNIFKPGRHLIAADHDSPHQAYKSITLMASATDENLPCLAALRTPSFRSNFQVIRLILYPWLRFRSYWRPSVVCMINQTQGLNPDFPNEMRVLTLRRQLLSRKIKITTLSALIYRLYWQPAIPDSLGRRHGICPVDFGRIHPTKSGLLRIMSECLY